MGKVSESVSKELVLPSGANITVSIDIKDITPLEFADIAHKLDSVINELINKLLFTDKPTN